MPVISIQHLDDPRLIDYRQIKDRQWMPEFSPGGAAAEAPFGKFMAEGEVVFQRLVRSTYRTLSVLCTPTRLGTIGPELALLPPETPVYTISTHQLETLAGFPLHRGLMAVGARQAAVLPQEIVRAAAPGRPLLVLEGLTNHDNIGAMFRNAAAFGAAGVLLTPGCADPLYRKSIRVSVGHVLRTPWAFVDEWPGFMAKLHEAQIPTIALTPNPAALSIDDFVPVGRTKPLALLFGTEGPGLSPECLSQASVRVRIPLRPEVDSLNVSVAAAITLHRLTS